MCFYEIMRRLRGSRNAASAASVLYNPASRFACAGSWVRRLRPRSTELGSIFIAAHKGEAQVRWLHGCCRVAAVMWLLLLPGALLLHAPSATRPSASKSETV